MQPVGQLREEIHHRFRIVADCPEKLITVGFRLIIVRIAIDMVSVSLIVSSLKISQCRNTEICKGNGFAVKIHGHHHAHSHGGWYIAQRGISPQQGFLDLVLPLLNLAVRQSILLFGKKGLVTLGSICIIEGVHLVHQLAVGLDKVLDHIVNAFCIIRSGDGHILIRGLQRRDGQTVYGHRIIVGLIGNAVHHNLGVLSVDFGALGVFEPCTVLVKCAVRIPHTAHDILRSLHFLIKLRGNVRSHHTWTDRHRIARCVFLLIGLVAVGVFGVYELLVILIDRVLVCLSLIVIVFKGFVEAVYLSRLIDLVLLVADVLGRRRDSRLRRVHCSLWPCSVRQILAGLLQIGLLLIQCLLIGLQLAGHAAGTLHNRIAVSINLGRSIILRSLLFHTVNRIIQILTGLLDCRRVIQRPWTVKAAHIGNIVVILAVRVGQDLLELIKVLLVRLVIVLIFLLQRIVLGFHGFQPRKNLRLDQLIIGSRMWSVGILILRPHIVLAAGRRHIRNVVWRNKL